MPLLRRPHHHHLVAAVKTVPSRLVRRQVASLQQSASSQVFYSRLFFPTLVSSTILRYPTLCSLCILFCFSFLGVPPTASLDIHSKQFFFLIGIL